MLRYLYSSLLSFIVHLTPHSWQKVHQIIHRCLYSSLLGLIIPKHCFIITFFCSATRFISQPSGMYDGAYPNSAALYNH